MDCLLLSSSWFFEIRILGINNLWRIWIDHWTNMSKLEIRLPQIVLNRSQRADGHLKKRAEIYHGKQTSRPCFLGTLPEMPQHSELLHILYWWKFRFSFKIGDSLRFYTRDCWSIKPISFHHLCEALFQLYIYYIILFLYPICL